MAFWRPPTCKCEIEFQSDMTEENWQDPQPQHILSVKPCETHASLLDPVLIFKQVYLNEVRPKSFFEEYVLKTYPGGYSADHPDLAALQPAALSKAKIGLAETIVAAPHLAPKAKIIVPANIDDSIAQIASLPIDPSLQQIFAALLRQCHEVIMGQQLGGIRENFIYDDKRVLQAAMPNMNDSDKADLQSWADSEFGAGKIVVG